MTDRRETRDEKLQSLVSRLDEIEKLQMELRKIVPKVDEEEVISDESSIDRSSGDSGSTESDRSNRRSVDACQQTKIKNLVKSEPPFDLLTYLFWSPDKLEQQSVTFKDQDSGIPYCSEDQTGSPRKSVSVSVQTAGQKHSADPEPFDLLDYLRLPTRPKAKSVTSVASGETPSSNISNKVSGAGRFSWLFGNSMEESTKNGHRSMASSDLLISNAPRTFRTSIGSKRAAADGLRTPAASAKLDQQQVLEKKQATKRKEVESYLEAKSQRTGDVVQRVGSIRVPLRETGRSKITNEWKPAIEMKSGLAGSSSGYRGNSLDNSHQGRRREEDRREAEGHRGSKNRMFKWFHKTGTRLKSLRDVEDEDEPEESDDSNHQGRSEGGLRKKSKCWDCCVSGSEVAEVVVPYHHTGDRTPRLVESAVKLHLDNRAETLRVVSSTARVMIRKSGQHGNFLSRR